MNPLQWDAPRIVVVAGLFCIVFLRASATYAIGRGLITGMTHTRFAHKMQGPRYRRATELVSRYGAPIVSLCFLTVGLQTLVLLAAGGLKMKLSRFIPALIVGSILWAMLYGLVGFVGFELWVRLYEFSPLLAIGGTLALVVGLASFILWRRISKRDQALPQPTTADTAAQ